MRNLVSPKAGALPEIEIYDDIGPDWAGMISGETVSRKLKDIGKAKEIVVRINSPGGDCFEAFAIYNALRRHGARIVVEIDSLAASAASLIAMAGDTIRIAENGMMMVHRCWTITAGNDEAHVKAIEVLRRVDTNLRATYAARTGMSDTEISGLLNAETWMSADESLAYGFVDEISQSLLTIPAPQIAHGRYRNTPRQFAQGGRSFDRIKRLNDLARKRNGIETRTETIRRKNDQARQRLAASSN